MTAVAVSYTVDGPADAPVVVLSNSLGATRGMWDAQVPALAERYRVLTYDTRGHGESPAPAGPYSLDDLVDDVVALLDEVGAERAHVVGLSLGRHDRRCGWPPASPRAGRPAGRCCAPRRSPTRARSSSGRRPSAPDGTAPLAPAVVGRWLTPAFARRAPATWSPGWRR